MDQSRYSLHLIAPTTGPHVYEFVESLTLIPVTPLTLASLTPDHYDITIIDEILEPIVSKSFDLAAISVMYVFSFPEWEAVMMDNACNWIYRRD